MIYYKFVKWEPHAIEEIKNTKVPLAIEEAEKGNRAPLLDCYHRGTLTAEHLESGIYKLGGWAFLLRSVCRKYWVKTRYNGICEYYAPNKTAIYNILSRYHVIKIIEI